MSSPIKLKAPKARRKPRLTPYQRDLIQRVMASDPPIVVASRNTNGLLHYSIGNGGAVTKASVTRLIYRQILVSNQDGLIADDPQSYRLDVAAVRDLLAEEELNKQAKSRKAA